MKFIPRALFIVLTMTMVAVQQTESVFADKGADQAINFFKNISGIMMQISGALAVIFIMYAGYFYLTSGGNFDKAMKGKDTLKHVAYGLAIIFAASLLVSVATDMLNKSFGG